MRAKEDLQKLLSEADEIIKAYEGKAMPEVEAQKLERICSEAEEIQRELELAERKQSIEAWARKEVKEASPIEADFPGKYMTIGDAFVSHPEYQKAREGGFKNQLKLDFKQARIGNKFFLPYVEVKDITSQTAGTLVAPQLIADVVRPREARELTVRDLLGVGTTTSNVVEYNEETFTNSASPVAEGTSKPQSDLAYTKKTATVKTLAHYIKVSEQMLADAGQISSVINLRLIEGLNEVEEDQLIKGDGTGENLTGILNTVGINVWTSASPRYDSGDTLLDIIRKMKTEVAVNSRLRPDAILVHPYDWEAIELLKGTDSHYIWTVVTEGGQQRIWRLQVVESEAMDVDGTRHILVGAFKLGAQIFDREGVTVLAGLDSDDFTKNKRTVRAEKRLAFVVWRPAAFCDYALS